MKRKYLAGSFAVKLTAILSSYAVNYLLIKLLTVEDFGKFSFYIAMASLAQVAVVIGFPQLITRLVAERIETGNHEGIAQAWVDAHLWLALFTIISFISVYISIGLEASATYKAVSISLAFAILTGHLRLRSGVLHGMHMTTAAQSFEVLIRPAVLATFLMAAIWHNVEMTFMPVLVLNAGACLIATLACDLYLRRYWPSNQGGRRLVLTRTKYRSSLLASAASLSIVSSIQMLILNIDILMISYFLGDGEAGIYRFAILIALLLAGIREAIDAVARPRISLECAKNNLHDGLSNILRPYIFATGIAVLAISGFAIFGPAIISRVADVDYGGAYYPALVMLLGKTIQIALGPVELILNMTGREKRLLRVLGLSLVLNIALNLALIDSLGVLGASISSAVTTAFIIMSSIRMINRHLQVSYVSCLHGASRSLLVRPA